MRIAPALDLQGHRGARAVRPENTLPAFEYALASGITTLELDCGITADDVVVVSHDPVLNRDLTRGPDGNWITGSPVPLRALTYDALRQYDVGRLRSGSAYATRFPEQVCMDGIRIPRLDDVFDLVARSGRRDIGFNIETKISPLAPELTCGPEAFADSLADAIVRAGVGSRATVQSFDWRTLRHVQQHHPDLRTVCLTAEGADFDTVRRHALSSPWTAPLHVSAFDGSVPRMVKACGAHAWSPAFDALDRARLDEAHDLGIQVIVWTVNAAADMRRLIEWGVDGIISDDPDLLVRIAGEGRADL